MSTKENLVGRERAEFGDQLLSIFHRGVIGLVGAKESPDWTQPTIGLGRVHADGHRERFGGLDWRHGQQKQAQARVAAHSSTSNSFRPSSFTVRPRPGTSSRRLMKPASGFGSPLKQYQNSSLPT